MYMYIMLSDFLKQFSQGLRLSSYVLSTRKSVFGYHWTSEARRCFQRIKSFEDKVVAKVTMILHSCTAC